MFLAAKIQYAHIKNQFNSFNTDQKSIRKSKKVAFLSKIAQHELACVFARKHSVFAGSKLIQITNP